MSQMISAWQTRSSGTPAKGGRGPWASDPGRVHSDDISCKWMEEHRGLHRRGSGSDVNELLLMITASLCDSPLEEDDQHPAEQHMELLLSKLGAAAACDQLFESSTSAADLLTLAGRVTVATETREALVTAGLQSPETSVRMAAMTAADEWEDAALLPLLESHDERNPLARTMLRAVIEGLRD